MKNKKIIGIMLTSILLCACGKMETVTPSVETPYAPGIELESVQPETEPVAEKIEVETVIFEPEVMPETEADSTPDSSVEGQAPETEPELPVEAETSGEEEVEPEDGEALTYEDCLGTYLMVTADIDDGFVVTHYAGADGGVTASLVLQENYKADFSYLSYDEQIEEYGLSVSIMEAGKSICGEIEAPFSAESWTFVYDGEKLYFQKNTRINDTKQVENEMVFYKAVTVTEEEE